MAENVYNVNTSHLDSGLHLFPRHHNVANLNLFCKIIFKAIVLMRFLPWYLDRINLNAVLFWQLGLIILFFK